jgi:hypothetical protein
LGGRVLQVRKKASGEACCTLTNVRFGSKADIGLPPVDVRFTPKADLTGRQLDVRFVPKADIMRCSNRSHLLGHAMLNFRQ